MRTLESFYPYQIAFGTPRSIFALGGQNPVDVAMKWNRLACDSFLITLRDRRGDQRPDRAFRLSLRNRPIQAITLAFITENSLRVLLDPGLIARLGGIFHLRVNQVPKNVDSVDLVGSDAPKEQFLLAGSQYRRSILYLSLPTESETANYAPPE